MTWNGLLRFLTVNKKLCLTVFALFFLAVPLSAEKPLFISDLSNPHDYELFANGGWDGNWYVGYNTCWIQKLSVPEGKYQKAFVGAKLGRMKSFVASGRPPWDKKSYDGEIFMGVSSTPTWNKSQSFRLTTTQDIPLEPDFDSAVERVGESRWFWTEIPIKLIQPGKDHFIAIWSPTKDMNSVSSSPILAAGYGSRDIDTWHSDDVKGAPPSTIEKAIATPVTIFEPAIALKLVPATDHAPDSPTVTVQNIEYGKARGKSPAPRILTASVKGQDIERAWAEISINKKDWMRVGRIVYGAPYIFTIPMDNISIGSDGKIWVRISALDGYANSGTSEPRSLLENSESKP